MKPELQARLLRVLQERELQRVGGTAMIPVDVQVIAATNRDLDAAMRSGAFRAPFAAAGRCRGLRLVAHCATTPAPTRNRLVR